VEVIIHDGENFERALKRFERSWEGKNRQHRVH
jgi:ribosomal protein S21